ncbi:MAG: helix-turn-helix domain-containing protein [Lachnospiraceae bacterium]|nr:helix-turn-helix domain-containing protein [Lachnospiraceae bacterium]
MNISQRVFALLKEKHLSQKDLSDYAGISPSAISNWKSQNSNPASDKIIKICEFLEVDPYFLLTGRSAPIDRIQEDIAAYEKDATPEEQMLLNIFRELTTFNKGRAIGQLEQIRENQNKMI